VDFHCLTTPPCSSSAAFSVGLPPTAVVSTCLPPPLLFQFEPGYPSACNHLTLPHIPSSHLFFVWIFLPLDRLSIPSCYTIHSWVGTTSFGCLPPATAHLLMPARLLGFACYLLPCTFDLLPLHIARFTYTTRSFIYCHGSVLPSGALLPLSCMPCRGSALARTRCKTRFLLRLLPTDAHTG